MQLNTEVNNFSPICIYDARTCLVFWPQFCQSGVTYLQQVLIINIHQLSSSVIYLANWTHFVEYKFIFLNIVFFNRNPSTLPFTCLLRTPHDLHNVEFASVWELCRSHVWPSSHAPACHRIGIHAELISGSPNTLLGPWSKYPTSALSLFHSACCLLSLQISIQKQSWVIIGINTEINWIRTKPQCLCKPHLYPSFTQCGIQNPWQYFSSESTVARLELIRQGKLFLALDSVIVYEEKAGVKFRGWERGRVSLFQLQPHQRA